MITVGRSLQGEKYTRCHDFCLCYKGNGYYLICVADGVGENTYCQIGSQIACESLRDFVEKSISLRKEETFSKEKKSVYIMLQEGFRYAVAQIRKKAEEQNHDEEEYGTTLSAIYIADDYAVWGHSGDGAIFSVAEDGIIEKLTTEKSGTASGEVYPLLSGAAWWSFGITEPSYAFILMTDGVLDYFQRLHQKEEISSFYQTFFTELEKENPESYIEKLVFSDAFKQCTRDDRTLAIAINEQKSIPSTYYYQKESLIKRPNMFAEIFVEEFIKQSPEINDEKVFVEQKSEAEAIFEHIKDGERLPEVTESPQKRISENKKDEQENTDNTSDVIEKITDFSKLNNDSVAELYGLTLDESFGLESVSDNSRLIPISLFELTGEQWAKYMNPVCRLAMADQEQITLTRIYKNDNKIVFLTMMELSKLDCMLDVDQGWENAIDFAHKLLHVDKYLLKFITEKDFELTEEGDKEYYNNICVNQFDYHNGVSTALAVTKNFDFLRVEFDMDFLEKEEILDIKQVSLFLDTYFYDIARSLWRSVLDREATINSNVPKFEQTDFQKLILNDALWADKVLHVERQQNVSNK